MKRILKTLIPEKPQPIRILCGPFRGARMIASPRNALRLIFGLYEHELNDWIAQTLPRVDKVLDVGANDGYFTFGCAAALRRLNHKAEIHAFEPDSLAHLELGILKQPPSLISIHLHPYFVGATDDLRTLTLDSFATHVEPRNALIKIDVEGMEVEVIRNATRWLNPTNHFLIEVHWYERYITQLRDTFSKHGLNLDLIHQSPLPIIGRENRAVNSWWLVSSHV